MARGTVTFIDGGRVGLASEDRKGKPTGEKVLTDCKGISVTLNGAVNKRLADIKPGDKIIATETGGKVTHIIATRK